MATPRTRHLRLQRHASLALKTMQSRRLLRRRSGLAKAQGSGLRLRREAAGDEGGGGAIGAAGVVVAVVGAEGGPALPWAAVRLTRGQAVWACVARVEACWTRQWAG